MVTSTHPWVPLAKEPCEEMLVVLPAPGAGGRGMLTQVLSVLDAESAAGNNMCLKYDFLLLPAVHQLCLPLAIGLLGIRASLVRLQSSSPLSCS